MMLIGRLGAGLAVIPAAALICAMPAAAQSNAAHYSGAWTLSIDLDEGPVSARLDLSRSSATYTGASGPLDPLGYAPLSFTGKIVDGFLVLDATARGQSVGVLRLKPQGGALSGEGTLFNTRVSARAVRAGQMAARAPATLTYDPTQFHPLSSSAPAPVLRVAPGDTVKTRTIDPYGMDEHEKIASMPGNPGTGPFYIEGALPGDTVAIHIVDLEPNRPTARMNTALDVAAIVPGHVQAPGAIQDPFWVLDGQGTARLRTPSERLKNFKAPVEPMLGVVTVALPAGRAVPNRDLGEWGGNLDYRGIRKGVTLYLPVFETGALIFLGDAHALQADGEITGQGLETSMNVTFKVSLIKGQAFQQPWAENDEFIMVSGIGGSIDNALRRSTSGMSAWLKQKYGLDDSEIAAVMGSSVRYDVAAVVSADSHIVAKLPKSALAQLPAPKP